MTRFRLPHAQKRIIDTKLAISGTKINLLSHYIAFPSGSMEMEAAPLYRNQVDNCFRPDVLRRPGFHWPLTTEYYMELAIEALDGLGYFDVSTSGT